MDNTSQFWRTKTLEEMTSEEWESLCDGCGRCCLVKLEDEDTAQIHYTDVACTLFDEQTCRCSDYHNRQKKVADCVRLTPQEVRTITWLPQTCAYRLLAEDKPLFDWHPLISGRAESVVEAGISVKGRISGHEEEFSQEDLIERIVEWPA
jgi:uncharacterized protein